VGFFKYIANPKKKMKDEEYWGVVITAITLTTAALIFLHLSRPPTVSGGSGAGALVQSPAPQYPTASNTYDSDCVAHMHVSSDLRLAVRVQSHHEPHHPGVLMIIDTAHDFNALTSAQDKSWADTNNESYVMLVTSEHIRVRERTLPAYLRIGNCPIPSLRQRTVVLPEGIPPPYAGVLGRPFLTAPQFLNVLLDLPHHSIHFNVDPRAAAPSESVIQRTTSRDAKHGLFLIDATIRAKGHENTPLRGRFILDTGAPRMVVAQSTAERLPWLQTSPHGRPDALDMSGHRTETRVHDCNVCIVGESAAAASQETIPVSFVVAGAEEDSILRDGHSDGLLGVACLRGMRVLWDNDHGAVLLLR